MCRPEEALLRAEPALASLLRPFGTPPPSTGEAGALAYGFSDLIHDVVEIVIDPDVLDADDLPAALLQPGGAFPVVCLPGFGHMCCAINLDGETDREAGEVDDIRADRVLPTEFEAAQLPSPQA